MFCMDDMAPSDHLLRIIDKAINWNFIYDLVEDKYSHKTGRPSLDPVMLIKIPLIQYLYGIKSMRQTVKDIEVNVAYRWFLGLGMYDDVPHFSTFGKNYTRRFKDTDLFEQIFSHILAECYRFKFVDPSEIFVDATHVKARANNRKMQKCIARQEAQFFEGMLKKEINEDRVAHGKKELKEKDKDDDDHTPSGGGGNAKEKTIKVSTSDPESRWFSKGEDIRYTIGMSDLYKLRKETIERLFGTAKENHGFRYTQLKGRAKMEMKVGLTYACLNLKKLARMKQKYGLLGA